MLIELRFFYSDTTPFEPHGCIGNSGSGDRRAVVAIHNTNGLMIKKIVTKLPRWKRTANEGGRFKAYLTDWSSLQAAAYAGVTYSFSESIKA